MIFWIRRKATLACPRRLDNNRNHGANSVRVLAGIQVPPPTEVGDFERFLKKLGYPYMEETGNPAYQLFLG